MKKIYIIALFSILIYSCHSKNYPINSSDINWEQGDQVKLNLILTQAKTVNGIEDEKYLIQKSFEIEVLEASDTSIILNFEEDNPLLVNISAKFSSIIPDEFNHQKLMRSIEIDKASKQFKCINSDEFAVIIQQTYEELKARINVIPDSLKSAFTKELETQYNGQKSADESEVLNLLLARYKYDFRVNQKFESIDSTANPFNLDKFPGGKSISYVTQPNGNKNFDLHVGTTYDFDSYKKMFSGLTSGLSNAMNGIIDNNDGVENDLKNMMNQMMAQLMAQIDFEASNEIIITQNQHKKWPTEILALNNLSIKQVGKIEKIYGSALIEIEQ